jgi:hypothetical protein
MPHGLPWDRTHASAVICFLHHDTTCKLRYHAKGLCALMTLAVSRQSSGGLPWVMMSREQVCKDDQNLTFTFRKFLVFPLYLLYTENKVLVLKWVEVRVNGHFRI